MVAVRMTVTVLVALAVLIVLLLAPSLLPAGWQYYVYLPASVGLWMSTTLIAPFVACAAKREWIKTGGKRVRASSNSAGAIFYGLVGSRPVVPVNTGFRGFRAAWRSASPSGWFAPWSTVGAGTELGKWLGTGAWGGLSGLDHRR
jgi:hypothetical protein